MDGSQPYNPRTVEEVFRDFKSRRTGIIKALTIDVEEFYQQCDPEKENLCLYGFPNEQWEVNLPAEEVPPELPEPALGINFARDGMPEKDWLALVAVHGDAWLLAVAFYFGARFGFDKADRKCLFNMINDLPTIFEVVSGSAKKQVKEKSTVSNHSSSKSKSNSKMSFNRGGGNGQSNKGKNIVGSSQNPWGPPVRASHNACAARTGATAIPPPLQGGWKWNSRTQNNNNIIIPNPQPVVEDEDEDEELDEPDDDILSDEYDDEVFIPHEERKKNKWYAAFFETLDTLTLEQVNEPTRQWHCPACQNGPGAIDWYKSLRSLITHAKTKGYKRVKIHRDLAVVLEEELRVRGVPVNVERELYGQWKGLNEAVKDKYIVWPPMVIIMNTQLEQDDNNMWTGMGNTELLDYFESYAAEKARHSYGPRGHMGMSVLIFQASAVGYLEVERLSQHFEEEGTDRNRWDRSPILFYPGGKRKLYGYMATKEDLDIFNKHSHGKSRLKYEMVSYQENVVNPLKQMNEDHQQLHYYKDRAVKDKMLLTEVEKSNETLSKIVRKSEVEKRIVRERMQQFNEQKQEEIDDLERFLKDQLKVIEDAKGCVDQMQHEEPVSADNLNLNLEEMKEFVERREKLMKIYEEKIAEAKSWYDAELTQLVNSYTLGP